MTDISPAADLKSGYVALAVPEWLQAKLEVLVPRRYNQHRGDHITLIFGIDESSPAARAVLQEFAQAKVEFYGTADDGFAVQAFLVKVNGQTHDPAGRAYHLTWSFNDTVMVDYDGGEEKSAAGSRHAGTVADRKAFQRRWPAHQAFVENLAARFYLQ